MTGVDQSTFIDVFSANAGTYDTGVEFFKPLAAKLIEHAGVRPGQRVLDVGCGRGAVLFPVAERVGTSGSVIGIDLAEGMVEATAKEAHERGFGNVTVNRMDGSDPDYPAGSFDQILGSMSIIFIPELADAFGRYHALLRDGGTLAFTAPGFGSSPLDWRIGPFDMQTMIDEAMPERRTELRARLDEAITAFPSLHPDHLLGDLRTAGFTDPLARTDSITVTAGSGKSFVDWTFSHGMRTFWDMIPDEKRRAEYAAELAARIDAERGDADSISYEVQTRVFLATK
ncbi:class I SAM-dependent methyltransferase [Sciscionella sediminilitoris]|uniref:class I SAM-dependent methyltransferase n=1 Tax=Sciscionella sediminilitoris TaxID=1445613 RepID=UPI00068AE4F8|nr:class I SAM-dependent methyltransferase [Sciscionella sp. SE31]